MFGHSKQCKHLLKMQCILPYIFLSIISCLIGHHVDCYLPTLSNQFISYNYTISRNPENLSSINKITSDSKYGSFLLPNKLRKVRQLWARFRHIPYELGTVPPHIMTNLTKHQEFSTTNKSQPTTTCRQTTTCHQPTTCRQLTTCDHPTTTCKHPSKTSKQSNTIERNLKTITALQSSSANKSQKITSKKAPFESFNNNKKSIKKTTKSISKVGTTLKNVRTTMTPDLEENKRLGNYTNTSNDTSTQNLSITPLGTTFEEPKVPKLTSPRAHVSLALGIKTTKTNTSQHNELIAKPNSNETGDSQMSNGPAVQHMPITFGKHSMKIDLHSLIHGLLANNITFNEAYDGNSKNINIVNSMTNLNTTLYQKPYQTTRQDFIIFPR